MKINGVMYHHDGRNYPVQGEGKDFFAHGIKLDAKAVQTAIAENSKTKKIVIIKAAPKAAAPAPAVTAAPEAAPKPGIIARVVDALIPGPSAK